MFGRREDGVVETNWKQHSFVVLFFFGDGLRVFLFDPRAVYGVLGEDEDELVVSLYRLLDRVPDGLTDFQVLRREPDADAVHLQIGVEFCGKGGVGFRVGDERGVIAAGFGDKRFCKGDHGFGQAAPAQKIFGDVAAGEKQGVHAERGRANVGDGFESDGLRQVQIAQDGQAKGGAGEICAAQIGAGEVRAVQTRLTEVCAGKVGAAQVGAAEMRGAEVGAMEVCFAKIGLEEEGLAQVGALKMGAAQKCAFEVGDFAAVGAPPAVPFENVFI